MIKLIKQAAAVLLCGGIILSAGCGCSAEKNDRAAEETVSTEAYTVTEQSYYKKKKLHCPYYDDHSFNMHLSGIQSYTAESEILCGTLPHHLTAGRLIAGFLKTAAESREKTDTVVIAATMHFTENSPYCTSYLNWETPFGDMVCDSEITAELERYGAECDDDMAELDHGISALVPYVKYFFPDSEIAFILVDNKAAKDTPDTLSQLFTKISAEKDCLFLFSIDFSHYLEPHETDRHDAETLEAVTAMDYGRIASMTDSNVDSRYLLNSFLKLSEKTERTVSMYDHSNSLILGDIPYSRATFPDGLTSYYIFGA